jgi:hypothetical protein
MDKQHDQAGTKLPGMVAGIECPGFLTEEFLDSYSILFGCLKRIGG